ncbi:MAG: sulfotransferase family 2 domain-containing protein [Caldilineaceae bacterium]|nr:sulfotransferase family 2 domain-containing protein [Caldilineaceae bacterium]
MTKPSLVTWIDEAKSRPPDIDGPGLNVADTWVSARHRYFCMAIPKAACSKIKIVLQQLEGLPLPPEPLAIHMRNTPGLHFVPSIAEFPTADAVALLTARDWLRFAFVRNPYARLFSAYKSQVMELTSPYVNFRAAIRQHAGYSTTTGAPLGRVGFADFVHYIAEQPDNQRDGHWKSQVGTLHRDRIDYDFIGRVETFQADFTKVLQRFDAPPALLATLAARVNTTTQLPLAAAYHKALADLVYTVYRDDFTTFDYDRDSWRLID